MNTEEYEKKKTECWETFLRLGGGEEEIGKQSAFEYAYNAAFNIGKSHTNSDDSKAMLSCPKEKVQDMYAYNEEILKADPSNHGARLLKARLTELFGFCCFSADNVEQNVLPSFIAGDIVRIAGASTEAEQALIGTIGQIIDVDARNGKCYVLFLYSKGQAWIRNSHLELARTPYDLPHIVPGSQKGKRSPYSIPSNSGGLKPKDAENELRLKIAAMAMHGLLASPVDANMQSKSVEYIIDASFEYADALIAKGKEGGNI